MPNHALSILATALLLAGCASVPLPVRETPAAPARYQNADAQSVRNLPARWWTAYHDAQLDALVDATLQSHPDMQSAYARLQQAEASLGLAGAARGAQLDVHAATGYTRSSENTPAGIALGHRSIEGRQNAVGVSASWDLDLWKRVTHAVEAAGARVEAARIRQDAYALVLSGEVAQQYWQLRAAEAELAVLESIRASRAESERVLSSRFNSGLVGELDVARARLELVNAKVLMEDARKRRELAEHALATLAGRPLAEFSVAPATADATLPAPPAIAPGLPAEVLARRPDLAESTQRLRALYAGMEIAQAAFYPSISLTGDFGFASRSLSDLANSGSRQFSAGPLALSLPILDGGRNRAGLALAKAQYQEEVAQHKSTLLRALREVDDALTELKSGQQQVGVLQDSLGAARRVALIARSRYDKGIVTYLDVTDAERSVLSIERDLVKSRAQSLLASVQLARALGGGAPEQK